jgi:hypothetical protein
MRSKRATWSENRDTHAPDQISSDQRLHELSSKVGLPRTISELEVQQISSDEGAHQLSSDEGAHQINNDKVSTSNHRIATNTSKGGCKLTNLRRRSEQYFVGRYKAEASSEA